MTAHLGPKPDDNSPLASGWNELRKLMEGKQLTVAEIEIVAFGFFYGARTVLATVPDRGLRNIAREIVFLESEIMSHAVEKPAASVDAGSHQATAT